MSTEAMALDMRVNGQVHTGVAQTRTLLSDFLRHGVGFTGVHVGCEHGVCGACTVLLDGAPVRSCLMFAVQVGDAEITTIEALASGNVLSRPSHRGYFWPNIGAASSWPRHM